MTIKYSDFIPDAYNRIPEARIGEFSIQKGILRKDEVVKTYFPAGFFYHDKLVSNFPFVKLVQGEDIWMSDSPMEQNQVIVPAVSAYGEVLVIGLGIGLFVFRARKFSKTIDRITIVEKYQEVADLVYPYMRGTKTGLNIHDGEEYLESYKKKYDFIYIDVWDNLMAPIREIEHWTNLAQKRLKPNGVVRCWLHELYDRVKDKLPKEPIEPSGLITTDPCLVCGKTLRFDYAGLCGDCADLLDVSEKFIRH